MDFELVLKAIVALSAIGLVASGMLAAASKRFHVEVDERVEAVLAVLPGSNCGACGNPSCFAAAEAMVADEIPVNACTAGGQSVWSLVQYGNGWVTDKKPVDVTRYDSARFWLNFRLFCMKEPIPGATTQVMDLSSAITAAPPSTSTVPSGGEGYAGGEEYGMMPSLPPAPEPTRRPTRTGVT